uniref:PLAT domain-containing protein n=1 Tax=Macrostomum lignano TaxID=282301 RepID=A0A1I8FW44_9PLAT
VCFNCAIEHLATTSTKSGSLYETISISWPGRRHGRESELQLLLLDPSQGIPFPAQGEWDLP